MSYSWSVCFEKEHSKRGFNGSCAGEEVVTGTENAALGWVLTRNFLGEFSGPRELEGINRNFTLKYLKCLFQLEKVVIRHRGAAIST